MTSAFKVDGQESSGRGHSDLDSESPCCSSMLAWENLSEHVGDDCQDRNSYHCDNISDEIGDKD